MTDLLRLIRDTRFETTLAAGDRRPLLSDLSFLLALLGAEQLVVVVELEDVVGGVAGIGGVLAWLVNTAISAAVGFVVGTILTVVVARLPFGRRGDT